MALVLSWLLLNDGKGSEFKCLNFQRCVLPKQIKGQRILKPDGVSHTSQVENNSCLRLNKLQLKS